MSSISFYARGDETSAKNPSINVENLTKQPTVLLTFNSSGPSGDIILEYNAGKVDPDTTVTINGAAYNFKVEMTGILPLSNGKVPDPLEGHQIAVISVVIKGVTERFFFVTDGNGTQTLMNQFGNGAVPLKNVNFAPPPIHVCFCAGTDILTPHGCRKVETLKAGDLVLTETGEAKPILWIASSTVSFDDMLRAPESRPIRIPAGTIAPGVPNADLQVSGRHRIVIENAEAMLLFGEARVLVAAKDLVGTVAERVMPLGDVSYYHLLLDGHHMVVSNGMVTESFQLAQRSFDGLSSAAQSSLLAALSGDALVACFAREDAMPSLKAHEAGVLAHRIFGEPVESATGARAGYTEAALVA